MKGRLITLAAIVVLAVAGTIVYVASVRDERAKEVAAAPPVPVADLRTVSAEPHVVFRSTAVGDGYGKVAMVALADPDGARAFTPTSCDRVYARENEAVCLYAKTGLVTTYNAEVLDASWKVTRSVPLSGVPSRTRLSPDSSLVATTTFVTGHDYTSPGQFSTETLVTGVADGKSVNLEKDFKLYVDGKELDAKDRNMWGVTFVDDDTFYATAASGRKTWLVRGSLSGKQLRSLREDAECPSVSPDRTKVAFKTRNGHAQGQWQIAVYDLASGKATILAEKHSVDDQIEWLDEAHVLYGLPRGGNGPSTSDVWTVPADGSGAPAVFIKDAWSPAVVR